jgi:hypothetical protein
MQEKITRTASTHAGFRLKRERIRSAKEGQRALPCMPELEELDIRKRAAKLSKTLHRQAIRQKTQTAATIALKHGRIKRSVRHINEKETA